MESVRSAVEELKKQNIDKIIAVGHSGIEMDKKIAKEVDGVDIVVGGHSHTFLCTGKVVGRAKRGSRVLKNHGKGCQFSSHVAFLSIRIRYTVAVKQSELTTHALDVRLPFEALTIISVSVIWIFVRQVVFKWIAA